MYTRCPGCHTVHPVNARLLAQERGRYRCGKCKQVNNALESLFDEWPDPGEHPPTAGKLPVLGLTIDLEAAEQARGSPGEAPLFAEREVGEDRGTGHNKKMLRTAWITTAIALLVFMTVYLVDFFGKPLPDFPGVGEILLETGLKEAPAVAPFRNLEQIHLLHRDLRSHPMRPDALNLSLTIVNRAPRPQAFPGLEVVLLDSSGQTLVSQLFKPGEYLAPGADIERGMTPEAYLQVNLELADPGRQAVGFEVHFQ